MMMMMMMIIIIIITIIIIIITIITIITIIVVVVVIIIGALGVYITDSARGFVTAVVVAGAREAHGGAHQRGRGVQECGGRGAPDRGEDG